MTRPRRRISEGRQAIYYVGIAMTGIGLLTVMSVFVTGAMNAGDFSDFDNKMRSSAIRAVIGFILFMGGAFVQKIGARGVAGSGLVLDPQRARQDVEPWARMGGGLLKDALDEADVDLSRAKDMSDAQAEDFEEKLRKLHRLHADGILTDEEFAREKREVLDRI
ncbi:MAG: SHOCT domain-containing protein [Planctomycetota bacterium]